MRVKTIIMAALFAAGVTTVGATQQYERPDHNFPNPERPRDIDLGKLFPKGPSRDCPMAIDAAIDKSCGPSMSKYARSGMCELLKRSCDSDNTSCIKRAGFEDLCAKEEVDRAVLNFNKSMSSYPEILACVNRNSADANTALTAFAQSGGCESDFQSAKAASDQVASSIEELARHQKLMAGSFLKVKSANRLNELNRIYEDNISKFRVYVISIGGDKGAFDLKVSPDLVDGDLIKWSHGYVEDKFRADLANYVVKDVSIGTLL